MGATSPCFLLPLPLLRRSCAKSGMLDMQLIDELCGAVESRIETFGCSHLAVICWYATGSQLISSSLLFPPLWLFLSCTWYALACPSLHVCPLAKHHDSGFSYEPWSLLRSSLVLHATRATFCCL